MLNMVRGDFYRLRHTKSFWITLVITVAVCVFAVASGSQGSMLTINGEPVSKGAGESAITGINALGYAANSMVFYCILPLIVIVLGSEYSKGTLKNIITGGMSRTSFFLGKFVSYGCVLFVELLLLNVATFITGTIIGGVGSTKGDVLVNSLLRFLYFFLFLLALTAVTNLFLYLSRNTVASVIAAIVIPSVVMTFRFLIQDWHFLEYVDLMGAMDSVSQLTFQTISDFKAPLIGSLGLLVSFLLLTNHLFNKQDL